MSKSVLATEADRVIGSLPARNKQGAAVNVAWRNRQAMLAVPKFTDMQFRSRMDAVREIGEKFFATHSGVYFNYRENGNDPFAVVKFVRPQWPACSHAAKQSRFHAPLKALGVEVVYSKRTRSILLRVR